MGYFSMFFFFPWLLWEHSGPLADHCGDGENDLGEWNDYHIPWYRYLTLWLTSGSGIFYWGAFECVCVCVCACRWASLGCRSNGGRGDDYTEKVEFVYLQLTHQRELQQLKQNRGKMEKRESVRINTERMTQMGEIRQRSKADRHRCPIAALALRAIMCWWRHMSASITLDLSRCSLILCWFQNSEAAPQNLHTSRKQSFANEVRLAVVD